MTFVSSLIGLVLLLSQPASTEDTLRRQLSEFLTAASHSPASAADKRVFDSFFADDVIYTRASGAVITKTDIMKSLDAPAPASPASAYSIEDVTVRGPRENGVAIVAFRLVQRLSDGTINRYRNTGTFLLRNGHWQAIAWQATPIPKP